MEAAGPPAGLPERPILDAIALTACAPMSDEWAEEPSTGMATFGGGMALVVATAQALGPGCSPGCSLMVEVAVASMPEGGAEANEAAVAEEP